MAYITEGIKLLSLTLVWDLMNNLTGKGAYLLIYIEGKIENDNVTEFLPCNFIICMECVFKLLV